MRAGPLARSPGESYRPPSLSLAYSGVWLIGSRQLYFLGQDGWELAPLAMFVTTGIALGYIGTAMNDAWKGWMHRRKVKAFEEKAQQHGHSRWATVEDIENSPVLNFEQGILLGSLQTSPDALHDIFFQSEHSASLFAPAGELKSMSVLAGTLFANLGTSAIINDPSGELYSICGPALRKQGYELYVLTPFPEMVTELIGQLIEDIGLDVFSSITKDTPLHLIRSQLQKIARWVIPDRPGMTEKDAFFYREGRKIFVFLAMHEMVQGRMPTLSEIRRHLMLGPGRLYELFTEAEGCSNFEGVYAELASALAGVLASAPQQFSGGFSLAEQHLDPFDHASAFSLHTQGSKWNPRELKDPNKKIALFVIYTLEMMETYADVLSTTMNYLFDTLAADTQEGRVTVLLDEAGMLKFPLAEKLDYYRKFSLRVLMVWQDLAQAEANHGKTGMRRIMAASRLKIFMGLQEKEMLELASGMCGTTSIRDMSLNDRANMAAPMPDLSPSLQGKDRPFLRPEEIRLIDRDHLLVVGDRLQPMLLKKLPWWSRPEWQEIAGPSPYYRG